METLNRLDCLIVEDEPLAAVVLEDYIAQVPSLHYVGRCPDAIHAAELLNSQSVDVVFLDIQLPGIKGLDFLRGLSNPPQAILTTAYTEYALEGYNLNAVDYLLKPFSFERFLQAVQKLRRPLTLPSRLRAFHFFNVNKKMVRVWLDEIILVESLREYVRIYLPGGKTLVTKSPLGGMEFLLRDQDFVRVHRSFLVSAEHIAAYTPTAVIVEGQSIPIGRQYKDAVISLLTRVG
jgi:DNA-binding LytR/AlgR family response regulator